MLPIQLLAKNVIEHDSPLLIKHVKELTQVLGRAPKLVVVLVGEDPASVIYTRLKGKAAERLGVDHMTLCFQASASASEVQATLNRLNNDGTVDGILLQRPLPRSFQESEIIHWVAPEKDIDAFHPIQAGLLSLGLSTLHPCTPAGIMRLLDFYQIPIAGKTACVVGRSSIVGKPIASLLLQSNATVLQCHSKTPDIGLFTRQADILIAAAGCPELIRAEHVRPGAVVIDVGIHHINDKVVGDVCAAEVAPLCSAITPVPGGVGPMTIFTLIQNTVRAAQARLSF